MKFSRTRYYKLPFVGPFSTYAQRRMKHLTQRYCKNLDIKLLFAPYKIKNFFGAKEAISKCRDVDNSRKPGKLPGCERYFSGCKALLLSPKWF